MTFETPIWITPPAKVKRLGIITKIISNIFTTVPGTISSEFDLTDAILTNIGDSPDSVIVTPGDYDLLVINNTASLIHNNVTTQSIVELNVPSDKANWYSVLDLYPGRFRAGLSTLRLMKENGDEIVAYISIDPLDDNKMLLNFDSDTLPENTIIDGRGTVDAIINPETYNPKVKVACTRYLILEDININDKFGTFGYTGPQAWKNADTSDFQAHANDIVEWDGSQWNIIFDSTSSTDVTYITNSYTGVQYKWVDESWAKSFEGVYDKKLWRLVL